MLIRWIGAFGSAQTLEESLRWELSQRERALAAEPIKNGVSKIQHPKIGLLIDPKALIKRFPGDVWSVPGNFMLRATRYPVPTHPEAWVRPGFINAIVIRPGASRHAKRVVRRISKEFNIPVLMFRKGYLRDWR